MELPTKKLEQIAFNTRPKFEEHGSIVMYKSTQEENLTQPQQTKNKQFKNAVTFLTGYIGIFFVTDKINKFYFAKSITDKDGLNQISSPQGAFELESLNDEFRMIIIDEGPFTEVYLPFTLKPELSTMDSIIEIFTREPLISFLPDDSKRNLLGFNASTKNEEYDLLHNPVDILSFDKFFLETDIGQGMIFKSKRSGNFHNFSMGIDPGYK